MSKPNSVFDARPHVWTLPLSAGRWAYLQLPSRCVDGEEWEQMHLLLSLMKQGLVTDRPSDDETELGVESAVRDCV